MSIPLVQKAEKDDINTSIIAIKRYIDRINQLLGLSDSGSSSDPDLSGLATKQELQDAVNSLQPVDEVTLNNMQSVTSNAVAKANALSDLEVITISTDSASPTEMQFDGILYIRYSSRGSTPGKYYLNGTEIITFEGGYSSAASGVTLVVVKGDTVYCNLSGRTPTCNARFYKQRDYSGR